MSPVNFPTPNFRCTVSRRGEVSTFPRLCHAEDEAGARALLESLGLVVHDVQPFDFETSWMQKAMNAATSIAAARQAGQNVTFPSYWSDLKDVLLDMMQGKCAYCEADFRHVAYGDVEHYRPKGKVAEDPNHRGYYWLAYEPSNYLPSCQLCNQYAKREHFPLAPDGKRAYQPTDSLEDEHALLLNPCHDVHWEHITYKPSREPLDAASAVGLDDKGRQTIETLDLNRQELIDMRRSEQEFVRLQIKQAIFNENVDVLKRILADVLSGRRQFGSAVMSEIDDFYASMGFPKPFP